MLTVASLGTWIWNIESIHRPHEVLKFLKAQKVTEVYLAYSPQTRQELYREFISLCSSKGIRVALIGSDARWILDKHQDEFMAFLNWFHSYQKACKWDSEKFYGLHLDIEPHQLPAWTEDLERTISLYMDLIRRAEQVCKREKVLLEVDIPFWFDLFEVTDEDVKMKLCEFCIRHCDTTLLMSYRDNAREIFECGRYELELSKKYNKKVTLAAETGKIYEEINITFYHLGTKPLERELQALKEIVEKESQPNEIGYAVHYYECWSTLPEDGHPKGEDYPYSNPQYK